MPVTQSADYIYNVAMNVQNVQNSLTVINNQAQKTAQSLKSVFGGGIGSGQVSQFLLSPLTNNINNMLQQLSNWGTNTLGANAESLGIPGARTVRNLSQALDVSQKSTDRLVNTAEYFGRQGIPVPQNMLETFNSIIEAQEENAAKQGRRARNIRAESDATHIGDRIYNNMNDFFGTFFKRTSIGSVPMVR
jgi:hypothetical protein